MTAFYKPGDVLVNEKPSGDRVHDVLDPAYTSRGKLRLRSRTTGAVLTTWWGRDPRPELLPPRWRRALPCEYESPSVPHGNACAPGCSECTDWFDSPLNAGSRVTADNPICPIRAMTCVRFIGDNGIQRECPNCGELLGYRVYHPPIPMIIREWTFGEPDEGHSNVVTHCPVCDNELPVDTDEALDKIAWTSW